MTSKKTLIPGVTTDSNRYALTAANRLTDKRHTIINVGLKTGSHLRTDWKPETIYEDIDTITLYPGAPN